MNSSSPYRHGEDSGKPLITAAPTSFVTLEDTGLHGPDLGAFFGFGGRTIFGFGGGDLFFAVDLLHPKTRDGTILRNRDGDGRNHEEIDAEVGGEPTTTRRNEIMNDMPPTRDGTS
jgi:hypothetical protein